MKKGVILYEGSEEKHVMYHLVNEILNIDVYEIFNFPEIQGYNQLLDMFPVQIKDSELKTICVIIDANLNISSRWDSLKKILKDSEYKNVPKKPKPEGIILTDQSPKLPNVGIWIMPDNNSPGMLEDFIKYLIPEEDNLIEYSKQCVQKLIDDRKNRFIIKHKSKAEMHTWLA